VAPVALSERKLLIWKRTKILIKCNNLIRSGKRLCFLRCLWFWTASPVIDFLKGSPNNLRRTKHLVTGTGEARPDTGDQRPYLRKLAANTCLTCKHPWRCATGISKVHASVIIQSLFSGPDSRREVTLIFSGHDVLRASEQAMSANAGFGHAWNSSNQPGSQPDAEMFSKLNKESEKACSGMYILVTLRFLYETWR